MHHEARVACTGNGDGLEPPASHSVVVERRGHVVDPADFPPCRPGPSEHGRVGTGGEPAPAGRCLLHIPVGPIDDVDAVEIQPSDHRLCRDQRRDGKGWLERRAER